MMHPGIATGSSADRRAMNRRSGEPGKGRPDCAPHSCQEISMLYTIAVVLIILWALGLVSSYTMGGFIHVLLVVAIIVVLLNVINGRKTG
jgi:hypothetical protein